MYVSIKLNINKSEYNLQVPPTRTLLDVLREDLQLTGTKKGCNAGQCGACTILMDGKPVNSCMILAVQAQGKEFTTIEGISKNNELNIIQKSYAENGAVQCGFCSPGFIMSTKGLLDKNSDPTEEEIKEAISGNICRCTGYQKIMDSIVNAADEMEKQRKEHKHEQNEV